MRRFCSRYGLDPAGFSDQHGAITDKVYALEGGASSASPPDSLRLVAYGKFGNNLSQVLKAIVVAKGLGINRIDLAALDLPLLRPDTAEIELGGMTFQLRGDPPPGSAMLVGYYWDISAFAPLELPNPDQVHRHVPDHIRGLFDQDRLQAGPEEVLTIQIRSGNLFSNPEEAVAGYTPPPLSYFELAVDHAISNSGVRRVAIVYEDRVNPCVAGLERHLRDRGIPFTSQSGALAEDVATLAGARHLVTCPGTFAPSAALLGAHTRSIYYFRMQIHSTLLAAQGVRIVLITDADGIYTPEWAWVNSAEQRREILVYPRETLSLHERSPDDFAP